MEEAKAIFLLTFLKKFEELILKKLSLKPTCEVFGPCKNKLKLTKSVGSQEVSYHFSPACRILQISPDPDPDPQHC